MVAEEVRLPVDRAPPSAESPNHTRLGSWVKITAVPFLGRNPMLSGGLGHEILTGACHPRIRSEKAMKGPSRKEVSRARSGGDAVCPRWRPQVRAAVAAGSACGDSPQAELEPAGYGLLGKLERQQNG